METLTGKRCRRIVARELWLNGKPSSPMCPLFIQTDLDEWFRVYFDDENYRWRVEAIAEGPKPREIQGDVKFTYKDVEVMSPVELLDTWVRDFAETEPGARAEARLKLSGGLVLVLEHDYKSDQETWRIERTGTKRAPGL